MNRLASFGRGLLSQERGITGLETAIVLIAFVVVSSVFAFASLSTGLFSSDKAKESIQAGLAETRGTLEVRGGVKATGTLTALSLTTVTGEAVGTGDGATVAFSLDNTPILTNSETVYVNSVAKTRDTDYTINFTTGAVTFTVAPPVGQPVTADYQHGVDDVATGDGADTTHTVGNTPVIPGSQTVYVAGTAETEGSDYTMNYDTGVITFTAAPANGARIDAVYTHYTVTAVKVSLSNAAGGQAVDMTGGETIVNYMDADTIATNITNYTLTKYNADADNLLETGEIFELTVNTSSYGLTDGDSFIVQVKPPSGAVVLVDRSIPASVAAIMDLG